MKNQISFYFLLILLTILMSYFLLVSGNILLQRSFVKSNIEALNIEMQRYEKEDKLQIQDALKEGYVAVLPPAFFDYPAKINTLQMHAEKYKFMPLGAQPNKMVYYCNEGYGLIKYKSDRYGFRNPDSIWSNLEMADVLLIGDSLVHGACVDEENTFRHHISNIYPNTINLGMAGSSPNNYLRTAEFFIKKTNPKKVIIFIFANDNNGKYRSIFNKKVNSFSNHLLEPKNYKKLEKFYDEAILLTDLYKNEQFNNNIYKRLVDDLKLEFIRSLISNNREAITDLIDNVINLCKLNSCDPYFVYLPTSDFWRPDSRQNQFKNNIRAYLQKEYNLESNFLDATYLNMDLKTSYAPKGPHYSNEGYKLISEEIIKMIE